MLLSCYKNTPNSLINVFKTKECNFNHLILFENSNTSLEIFFKFVNTNSNHFVLITTLTKGTLKATIHSKGAELIALHNSQREFIWDGNPDFWGKHSPILFPIVGTLKNNQYQYNGKNYTLSRHGFARDKTFTVIEQSENKVIFSLQSDAETLQNYPFAFELQVIYTLEQDRLQIQYKVFNKSDATLYFAIGAHPAFALTEAFENYSIAMEQNDVMQYHLLENDLLSNETKRITLENQQFQLNYSLFENDALVFKNLKSQALTILENQKPLLAVRFEGFPNLGIWTKKDAPFVCIEPWFGYADTADSNGDLMTKEGIQQLEVSGIFEAEFSVTIY